MESGKTISQVPGTIVGAKYRLETPLARGGMGAVWIARHIQLDVTVAVKFMDPACASSSLARARFEREAKAAASLHSPHIVAVRDYGVEGNSPYLVMELLKGENLSVRIHRERRLSLQATSKIMSQIAKALRRAHEAGLIHRDLKPANIFLARQDDDEDEVVKVLDFGIAKDTAMMLTRDATGTGEIMGSPHYMSPEQVRCEKDLDARSDLWSLGVITFRALTGKLPFPGEVLGAVLARVLADPIPVASELVPDLPAGIDAFFAKVLVRDRTQRFASAKELADELAALADAQGAAPVEARKPIALDAPPPLAPEDQTKTLFRPPAAPASRASHPSLSSSPDIEISGAAPALTSPVTLTGGGGATNTVRMARNRSLMFRSALLGALMLLAFLVGFGALRLRRPDRASAGESAPIVTETPTSMPAPPEPTPLVAPLPTPLPTTVVEVIPAPAIVPADSAAPAPPTAIAVSALPKPSAAPRPVAAPATTPKPAVAKVPSKPKEKHPGIGF
ncbi:MAG: serine/threonine-protein kinase [Minicystis sp.]